MRIHRGRCLYEAQNGKAVQSTWLTESNSGTTQSNSGTTQSNSGTTQKLQFAATTATELENITTSSNTATLLQFKHSRLDAITAEYSCYIV